MGPHGRDEFRDFHPVISSAVSRSPTVNRVFGGAVGVAVGSLTVAAHGLGGGVCPDSASLTLLAALCVAVGVVASTFSRPKNVTAICLLAVGQTVGHYSMSGMTGSSHSHGGSGFGGWQMVGAHAIATLLCAALIATASRLYVSISTTLSAVLRAILPPPTSARSAGATPVTQQPLFGAPLRGAISRRGPPALPA